MKWIVDADPGIDDAAAILAVFGQKILDVIGITAVHGNVGLGLTTKNALRLCECAKADVPVYGGASQAILEPPRRASEFHGKDGLGDSSIPEPTRELEPKHAVDFIIESAKRYKGELCLLALGPLTNVALAIAKERDIVPYIHRIFVMGGTSRARGNTTATAEFNIYADPEAAAAVFSSGIPATVVPWETCVDTMLPASITEKVLSVDTPSGRLFAKCGTFVAERINRVLGTYGLLLCDLVAACVAMDENVILAKEEARVSVETSGSLSRGLMVIDEKMRDGSGPNATVCLRCDRERVGAMFLDALRAL